MNSKSLIQYLSKSASSNSRLKCIHTSSTSCQDSKNNLKSYEDIPGPKGLPLVGNLFSLKRFGGEYSLLDNIDFVEKLHKNYGDIVKWSFFGTKQVFIYNADYMKKVMQSEPATPKRRTLTPYIIYMKKRNIQTALLNANGEEWRKLRSAANPIVGRPQTVALYLPKYNAILNEFMELIRQHEGNRNTKELIFHGFEKKIKLLALEMNSIAAFDERINCMNDKNVSNEVVQLMESLDSFMKIPFKLLLSFPLWRFYSTKDWKAFEAAGDTTYRIGRKYVNDAFKRIESNQEKDLENENLTILQQFLLKREKSKLNIDEILSLMLEFLLAGVDTAATALHYILYEISRHPVIQQELYEEIQRICKTNADITDEMLSKMPFLKACVKEALRMHSLPNYLSRELQEDLVLGDYLIPKGTLINYTSYFTSRSERYFKNALEYNPKRWSTDKDLMHPFGTLPFGHGGRSCLGRRLAEQEIYLIIIKLLQSYKIDYIGEKINPTWEFIIYPGRSLDLKLSKR